MQGLVDLVPELPPSVRKLWNGAKSRDFNVGIQSALKPHCHELRLTAKTLEAVARVRGSVVITTYAPIRESRRVRSRPYESGVQRRDEVHDRWS
jgi:hypothetical protein